MSASSKNEPRLDMKLSEAIVWLRSEGIKRKVKCPCCDKNYVIKSEKFTVAMAKCLFIFEAIARKTWKYQDVKALSARHSMFAINESGMRMLKYWNLIEGVCDRWRITNKGIAFAQNRQSVGREMFFNEGRVARVSQELIRVTDLFREGEYESVRDRARESINSVSVRERVNKTINRLVKNNTDVNNIGKK